MKKRICLLAMLIAMALLGGCASANGEKTFVTSFYPMYIFAQNIADGVPGVKIVNLAGESTGLTTWPTIDSSRPSLCLYLECVYGRV